MDLFGSTCRRHVESFFSLAAGLLLAAPVCGAALAIFRGAFPGPGAQKLKAKHPCILILHGGPALAPGPTLMFLEAMKLDQACHDYLNQTANCTPLRGGGTCFGGLNLLGILLRFFPR